MSSAVVTSRMIGGAGHDARDIGIAAQARGVVEQHAHCHPLAARIAGHEFRQRIVKRQLAGLDQFQRRSRRELLGDRPDPEHVVGGQRHAQLEVGAAAGAAVEHLVAACQQDRHSRRGLVAVGVQRARGERRHVGPGGLGGRRLRGGEEQCDQQGSGDAWWVPMGCRGMSRRGAPALADRFVQHQLAHEAHRRRAIGQHLVVVGLER
jgi:hypothetical protein